MLRPRHPRPSAPLVAALLAALLPAAPGWAQHPESPTTVDVAFPAADGDTVFGTWYVSEAEPSAVVVAFHQAGASGSGEYAPIAARLIEHGYHLLAVDQRSGGGRFGGTNRTVERRGESTGYCEAAPDLSGALAHARERHPDRPLILWGSSYSGALVLRLAAERPPGLSGVLAFSPASGGPMAACRARDVSDRIDVPVLALRPERELGVPSARAQFERFREQGHRTFVAEPGTHGSSMLVEERVGAPVEATWEAVMRFLGEVSEGS